MKIVARAYDHPDVSLLVGRLQAEYVRIYGLPDDSPTEVGEFSPPRGAFAVGYEGAVPVAMGGWRLREDGRAELKRMYVTDDRRGRGHSRAVLAWLEESAAAAGAKEIVLETTGHHPAAIGLYRSCGYTDIPSYGYYGDDPQTLSLGRTLPRGPEGPA
jgi:GNAT superfamily N-acetyltransferase